MAHLSLTPNYKLRLNSSDKIEFKLIKINYISSGDSHLCIIDDNNRIWTWGYNVYGQIGDNTTINKSNPVILYGNKTFNNISSGGNFNTGFNGYYIWSWGQNNLNQLGDNTSVDRSTPVLVYYQQQQYVCKISSGNEHTLILNDIGQIFSWGNNIHGQLGNNSSVQVSYAVKVFGNHTFINISAGDQHSLAIDNNNKLWGWGYNNYGQLGDNTFDNKSTPVAICNSNSFEKISGGNYHSMGIDYNSKLWGWGYNDRGQLGINSISITCKETPVSVYGNKNYDSVLCGNYYTIALSNYQCWSWGNNNIGQLGDNTTIDRSTPVSVYGNHSFLRIYCKYTSSFGIDINGKLWGWGYHTTNDLNGKQKYYSTPVALLI